MLRKIQQLLSKEFVKNKYERYENHISSLALILGFIIDSLTLRRVDLLPENIVLITYLFISSICIIAINIVETRRPAESVPGRIHFWLLIAMQFSFGGLFSAFLVFYGRSASFSASWPFLLILLFGLIGNELFKKQYTRLSFQVTVFFTALFSYLIFIIPVLTRSISPWSFLLSCLLAVILIYLFLKLLGRFVPEKIDQSRKRIIVSVGVIWSFVIVFYFANIIPPIPLSLKDVGVYHFLARSVDGNYTVQKEKEKWYHFFGRDTFHFLKGEPVYVQSAVFAPTKLTADIVHEWQYFDEIKESWITASTVKLPVKGGRDGGYRSYSVKSNIFPGLWRVNVATLRGQTIGRLKFGVEIVDVLPELEVLRK